MKFSFAELYQPVSEPILLKARQIKLLICDVDGVFSDGRIYLGNAGEELKAFHTRDGYGIKELRSHGIEVAIITGRRSTIVEQRMQALGIQYIYQGQEHKLGAYQELKRTLSVADEQVAYIGDDLSDWVVMQHTGLSIAVADAHPLLCRQADYCTKIGGGHGAVRELTDLILYSQDKLALQLESST